MGAAASPGRHRRVRGGEAARQSREVRHASARHVTPAVARPSRPSQPLAAAAAAAYCRPAQAAAAGGGGRESGRCRR